MCECLCWWKIARKHTNLQTFFVCIKRRTVLLCPTVAQRKQHHYYETIRHNSSVKDVWHERWFDVIIGYRQEISQSEVDRPWLTREKISHVKCGNLWGRRDRVGGINCGLTWEIAFKSQFNLCGVSLVCTLCLFLSNDTTREQMITEFHPGILHVSMCVCL